MNKIDTRVMGYLERAIDILARRYEGITVNKHGAVFVEIAKMIQLEELKGEKDLPTTKTSGDGRKFNGDTPYYITPYEYL